jgi:hypothetical protein
MAILEYLLVGTLLLPSIVICAPQRPATQLNNQDQHFPRTIPTGMKIQEKVTESRLTNR